MNYGIGHSETVLQIWNTVLEYPMGCFGIIFWIWRTIPEHPFYNSFYTKKSVVEQGVPKLFSRFGGQFRNTSFHNSFYIKN